MLDAARACMARGLENGAWYNPLTRGLAALHAPFADRALVRPLSLVARVPTICVGGATLGGSGKTRVALSIAMHLANAGRDVVLVGHGYRASPLRAREVRANESVAEVGDEALACARAALREGLADRLRVVVGPTRTRALAYAAQSLRPSVVVVDGPLQTRPRRAHLSILAVDAESPWGSGAVLPAGDLRARPAALLALADHVVRVSALPSSVRIGDETKDLTALTGHRFGLFTALGRPKRLVRGLAARGLVPQELVSAADHGPVYPALRDRLLAVSCNVDVWVATEKCAIHLSAIPLSKPLAVLGDRIDLEACVVRDIEGIRAYAEGS